MDVWYIVLILTDTLPTRVNAINQFKVDLIVLVALVTQYILPSL